MRVNAFYDNDDDTTRKDFCVMGYDISDEEINLVCGTEQTVNPLVDTLTYDFDVSSYYGVTDSYNNFNVLAHAGQHEQSGTADDEDSNLDEIITSYGVFKLQRSALLGVATLSLIYDNPKQDATIVPVDVMGYNRAHLLALTSTNLWYISDGYVKSPSEIDTYSIDPCLNFTWKQNTSVSVTIKPTDIDGDTVSARAILYYGDEDTESVDSWDYADLQYSVNEETSPEDLYYNEYDNSFYVLGNIDETVYKYNSNLGYTGDSYSVEVEDNNPYAILFNGTDWFMIGQETEAIFTYGVNFTNPRLIVDLTTTDLLPVDITTDGEYYYMLGQQNDKVYKYDLNWIATGESFSLSGQMTTPEDFMFSNGIWYVYDSTTTSVYEYSEAFAYTETLHNLSGVVVDGVGITFAPSVTIDHDHIHGYILDKSTLSVYEYHSETIGDGVQDSDWTSYADVGTTFSFSFVADRLTGSSVLRIMARSSDFPTSYNIIDKVFSVGVDGIEFGDCITIVDLDTTQEIIDDDDDPLTPDIDDNAISKGLQELDETTNSGLGVKVWYFIFMAVILGIIWVKGSHTNPSMAFAIVSIVGVLMLLIGLSLEILGIGTLMIIVIVALAVIVIQFKDKVFGGG